MVVFSDDPDRWTIPNSRFVASARPDQDGHFKYVVSRPVGITPLLPTTSRRERAAIRNCSSG